jgi:integrase
MDPRTLLDVWLTAGTLRPSSQASYRQEVTSWLDWCDHTWPHNGPHVDPYHFGIEHVAAWAYDRYLRHCLDTRPFDGPAALAWIAEHHPAVAKSHDRRITCLTGYYKQAQEQGVIRIAPDLTELRSGLDRDDTPPKRLNPSERATLFAAIGGWGPNNARHYLRDRLIAYLLLEGLRPSEVTRVDMRHLYDLEDGRWEIRAPDDFENVGKKFVLEPLTSAALKAYLPKRIRPAEGVHNLIIRQGGQPIVREYVNMIVQSIAATYPILADREPPVTADTIAHTGFWDTPQSG